MGWRQLQLILDLEIGTKILYSNKVKAILRRYLHVVLDIYAGHGLVGAAYHDLFWTSV
jgi:hypothetical protein